MVIDFSGKLTIEEGFSFSLKKSCGLLPFEVQVRETFVTMRECDENNIRKLYTLLNKKNENYRTLPSTKVKVPCTQERR